MKNVFLMLCLVCFLSACDKAGVESYHRPFIDENVASKMESRYLHEEVVQRFYDLGESQNIRQLKEGDTIAFNLTSDIYLSYHPKEGYILEVVNDGAESQYALLGGQDFVLSLKNRKTGILRMKSYPKLAQISATKALKTDYCSFGGVVKRDEYSYYISQPIEKMLVVKYGSKLSFCWKNEKDYIIYHAQFPKDNFVIKSGGDFLSTKISYEQEYRQAYSRREGYRSTWWQRDVIFKAHYYDGNEIKEYNFGKKAPQLEQ